MNGIRIHELSKEIGVASKDILEKLSQIGFDAKSHMSTIDQQVAERVRNFYRPVKIIEKRVTPSVIRRRVKVEKVVAPPKEEPVVLKEESLAVKEELITPKEEVPPTRPEEKEVPVSEPAAQAESVIAQGTAAEVSKEGQPPSQPETPPLAEKPPGRETPPRRGRPPRQQVVERRGRVFRPTGLRRGKRTLVVSRKEAKRPEPTVTKAIKRVVKIVATIIVGDLAKRMGVKASELIRKLISLGTMANINYVLDFDSASLLAQEFGYEVENVAFEPELILDEGEEKETGEPVSRPPIVTVMGHVDHGKTSLLDAVRRTNVAALEAGGITQHIGAYQVKVNNGQVTFLDTPGHEAFTAMRARGAQVTDLVVLVVAADDGVMPQTVEAIDHARAAQVPILVAINKIDKPNADVNRVKQGLSKLSLVPEEWGGNAVFVEVSAKKETGIDDLLELILLQAELLDLKANPNKLARGSIVEAKLDKGRGPVATVLIQEGTLKPGDPFVCGTCFGRVRAMFNEWGQRVSAAEPSHAVEVVGISAVPEAGESFRVVVDERKAKEVSLFLRQKEREKELSATRRLTLEEVYSRAQKGEVKELNIIIKADVQGSVEALNDSLLKLSTEMISLKVIHSGAGTITESDIMLAQASGAIVIGFNVKPENNAHTLADRQGVDVRLYDVIYNAVSDVRKAMEGLLEPIQQEIALGRAEVLELFRISRVGMIAGCRVTEGKLMRGSLARLLRNNEVIYEGNLTSLKRFKDDAKEVEIGLECGLALDNYKDIHPGDIVESYRLEKIAAKLE
ncbi:MAG: translation initiation factor IF-2 [Thermodesulfobacteriota bacterium]